MSLKKMFFFAKLDKDIHHPFGKCEKSQQFVATHNASIVKNVKKILKIDEAKAYNKQKYKWYVNIWQSKLGLEMALSKGYDKH